MKRLLRLCILLLVLCMAQGLFACALAEDWEEETEPERVIEPSPVTAFVPIRGGSAEVKAKEINGETWLLLPAFADVSTLSLCGIDAEAGTVRLVYRVFSRSLFAYYHSTLILDSTARPLSASNVIFRRGKMLTVQHNGSIITGAI